MTFPGLLNCSPPKIPIWTPWGGVGLKKKKKSIDFLGSSWHFPDFWIFDPLKSPLAPPWGRVGQTNLGSNQSHIHPNMCAKFGCGPTGVNAMLVWQSRNVQKLRHPATLATIFLERPSLGSLVVWLITGDPIGISGVKYLCVAIRSLVRCRDMSSEEWTRGESGFGGN